MNEQLANNDRSKTNKRKSESLTPFCFYQAMNYPIPRNKEIFAYQQPSNWKYLKTTHFSREQKNSYLAEFLHIIQKRSRIFPQFPFISTIYLANSITFNALKPSSDIDLFIITQKKRIWLARAFISVIMRFLKIKRSQDKSAKKFCLSFFIDEKHQNLEPLLLDQKDIYLAYRIAHLVPIYSEKSQNTIYQENQRVKRFLPNRTPEQHIYLDIPKSKKRGVLKIIIEYLFFGKRWDLREQLISKLRSIRIAQKKAQNPDLNKDIIINDHMLKFHYDKRAEYRDTIFTKK